MAATLTGKIQALIDLTYSQTVGAQVSSGNVNRTPQFSWTSGIGAGQADKIYTLMAQSIGAAGTLDLDLAGSVTDIFGATITFARIKAIAVLPDPGNVNNVHVGGAAANQFATMTGAVTDKIVVRPGGLFLLVCPDAVGMVVTAATADILRFTNSGGGSSVLFDLVIIGASA